MVLTTLAQVVTACLLTPSGTMNAKAGAVTMQPEHLLHHLNYPWQAAGTTTVVRSSVWVLSVTTGLVRLVEHPRGAWASVAVMPPWAVPTVLTAFLSVVLRIDPVEYDLNSAKMEK